MNQKEFGEYFAEIRKRENYKSQRDLADKSGISNATISRIESGITKPTPEVLRELANCFVNVTYEELMQNAGYLDIESVIEEYKDVYDKKRKLSERFDEILQLTRFCKFYSRNLALYSFFDKRRIKFSSVAENIGMSHLEFIEIAKGRSEIKIETAIKLAMYYKFSFLDLFKLKVNFMIAGEKIDEELIFIKLDELVEEELKDIAKKNLSKESHTQKINQNDRKQELIELVQLDDDLDVVDFLIEQYLLYKNMNLRKSGGKIK